MQARSGSPAVPALKQALKDPDENVRSYAAYALQQIQQQMDK
jgi:HEAT repeat protein